MMAILRMSSIKKAAEACESLYHRLGRKILKVILKRNGGDLDLAEQVVQDTFVAAYKSFHTFHHKSTYFTWLTKIALNKLTDYYRGQVNKNSRLSLDIPAPLMSPEEKMALDELKSQVNACLNLLPPEYRQLLQLRYYEDLSLTQIAVRLHLTLRSLEGKLYRAKKHLAQIITTSDPHP